MPERNAASKKAPRPAARSDVLSARRTGRRHLQSVSTKAESLVALVGSRAELARMLNVARTQPGRWISGAESPSPETFERLVDFEYLLSRVAAVWYDDMVMDWMAAPNPFLDGARPIDIVRLHGPSAVIAAIDAETAGSYA